MKIPSFAILIVLLGFARADISLPGIFSDRMVLQRDMPAAVFGSGKHGRTITVTVKEYDEIVQTKSVPVGQDQRWRLFLDPMRAGGPYSLEVSDQETTLTIRDVLFGEVWLMSGQSNMANPVGKTHYQDQVEGDDFPNIRAFNPRMGWMKAEPFNIQFMYAQAYFFAKAVHQIEVGLVPVGFYSAAYVNSAIHEWMDPLSLAADPESAAKPGAGRHYNNLVRPAMGYTFRGMIWDQGENNAGLEARSELYGEWLRRLILNWRALSENPYLHVIVTQLPTISDEWRQPQTGPVATGGSDRTARIRQGQFEAMALPGVYLVTTWDISDGDIHPRNAHQKGERAARVYQNRILGLRRVEYQGPTFHRKEQRGGELVLHFLHTGRGLRLDPTVPATLQSDANPATDLLGMAVAGEDGVFHWAEAVLGADTITLSSPAVARPTQARYVWADDIRQPGNLVNSDGLPAPSFRSDLSVPLFVAGMPLPALPSVPGELPPPDVVYEGEKANITSANQGGSLDFRLQLSGGAYLSTNGKTFATEWNRVAARSAEPQSLLLRYRSQGATLRLIVNGDPVGEEIHVRATNGGFATQRLPDVSLRPGRVNKIKLQSADSSAYGVDIDALAIGNLSAFQELLAE